MKFLAAMIPGGLFAYAGSSFIRYALSQNLFQLVVINAVSFVILWIIAAIFCWRASSARDAWHQIFSALTFTVLIIPVAAMAFRNRMTPFMTSDAYYVWAHYIEFLWCLCLFYAVVCAIITFFLRKKPKAKEITTQ